MLHDLSRAAAAQDADAFAERLAAGFRGEGGLGRSEALAELRRYFMLYENVEVATAGLEVDRTSPLAIARFRASLAGKPKEIRGLAGMLPDAARFRFELTLSEETGTLKVAQASWERIEPQP